MGRRHAHQRQGLCPTRQEGPAKKRYGVRGGSGGRYRNPHTAPKKRQRLYYSGKKKRHTVKSQVVINPKSRQIICTATTNGKRHDFKLLKESKVRFSPGTKAQVDTGYLGIQKVHPNSELPKKRSKKNPLSQDDKANNRRISSERVANEHVIGAIKRFRIVSDKYRNRRKRFGLRFNLISGIYNFELGDARF